MSKVYKSVIVGGGAAGLLCAVELLSGKDAFSCSDVLVLERNDRVGKKLVATGNGQCNLDNAGVSAEHYYGDREFIECFIKQYNEICPERYFYKLGIPFETDGDGRRYPLSRQASAVSDIIRLCLENKNCKTLTDSKVIALSFSDGSFRVTAEKETYRAENVVLAVGGAAARQFGTDGSSYVLAKGFGHRLTPLYPSLVQLKTELGPVRGLKGIKEHAKISAFDGKKYLCSAVGDVLFTEYGVSGNAVFSVSSRVVSAKDPILKIEFLPEKTEREICDILEYRKTLGYIDNKDALCALVNKRVGQAILKASGDPESIQKTVSALKNFTLKVTGNTGFNNAQVTKGGIDTRDVECSTMESRLQKGLYITGEMLDVDGDCGGYNLAFSFVSGITAARAIKTKYRGKDINKFW